MSKRKKKSGKVQVDHLMNFVAAFVNLVAAILLLIEKLAE